MKAAGLALALLAACGAAAAETHVVTIEDMKFQPATLTVQHGDTVVWKNQDITPHTVTAAGKFDSRNIAGGQSWTWKAEHTGRFDYVCTYHLGMKATVVVR
jgi:plastocyanin